MTAPFLYRPLPIAGLRMMKLQLTFGVEGLDRELKIGDARGFEATPTISETKVFSDNTPTKRLRKIFTTQKELEVSLEVKDFTPFTYAAMVMGDYKKYLVQSAVADGVFSFADPKPGDVFNLWKLGVQNVDVDGWTAGIHYGVNTNLGRIEIYSVPAGETTFEGTYSALAITAEQKRICNGLLESNGIRGMLHGESVDEGQPVAFDIWQTELRPDGAMAWGTSDDKESAVKLKGSAYEIDVLPNGDPVPAGQGFGRFYFV